MIEEGYRDGIVIYKKRNTYMDWLGDTYHKKSCILIWKCYKSSKTYVLQIVDKLGGKSVCTPMSKKQLLQLSEDIQNYVKEDTDG